LSLLPTTRELRVFHAKEREPMNKQTIQCKRKSVRIDLGLGNRLILFQGDKISVSTKAGARGRFRLFDINDQVIGHLTKRDIEKITGEHLYEGGKKNVPLVSQR
jgi:hypothetical protein